MDTQKSICFAGFDWGWKDDLASLGLLFPSGEIGNRHYEFKTWSWIPERCKRDLTEEPWRTWITSGQLRVTSGDTTDMEAIYKTMEDEILPNYQLRTIAFDPNNAREFAKNCTERLGLEAFPFIKTKNNISKNSLLLYDAQRRYRINLFGNTLFSWGAFPSLPGTININPIITIIMAMAVATVHEVKPAFVC